MSLNTNKKQVLVAGGLCLVASEVLRTIRSNKVLPLTVSSSSTSGCWSQIKDRIEKEEELVESEDEADILEFERVGPRSFAVPVENEPVLLTEEDLKAFFDRCNVLADSPTTQTRIPEKGCLCFKPTVAIQQLKTVLSVYHADATYEDNFTFLSSSRLIFFHFLILIWCFSQVDVYMKTFRSQQLGSRKCVYIAECSRKYIFKKAPFLHYFLPKGINLRTTTMCLVEEGKLVKHQDRYSRVNLSWRNGVPCAETNTKSLLGILYAYILRVFCFLYNIIALLRSH